MPEFKKSRYTYVMQKPQNSSASILYSSRSGAVVEVPSHLAGIISGSTFELPEHSVVQKLINDGFIVNPDFDELDSIRRTFDDFDSPRHLHLILLPTEKCNFRCVYCYEGFLRGQMSPAVKTGIKNMVRKRVEEGLDSLQVSWFGGEPLVGSRVIEELSQYFISICSEHGTKYMAGMTTNGYLLTQDMFHKMTQCGVLQYQISLDGTAQEHDKHRKLANGKPTYEVITRNLRYMASTDDDFLVNLRFNFDLDNMSDLDAYIEQITEITNKDPRFKVYGHVVEKWGGPNDADLPVASHAESMSFRIKLDKAARQAGLCDDSVFANLLRAGGSSCYAARKNCFTIGSDGRVMKCTLALEDEINMVGKVDESGDLNLDVSKFELWTSGGERDLGCQSCHFYGSCRGDACPLYRIEQQSRPCPDTRKMLPEILTYIGAETP